MTRPLGIGIIGCGKISDVHAQGYLMVPRKAKIVATADVDEERARSKAEIWNAESYYSDYKQLLARKDVDAVDICSPHYLHAEMSVAAAKAKKHILLEKPIATTIEEADQIVRAVRSANVKLMVAFNRRFMLANRRMKELVSAGAIGRIFLAAVEVGGFAEYPSGSWRASIKESGGGALAGAIHAIDQLRWLVGEVSAVQASAEILTRKDVEIDDSSIALLKFQSGALGCLAASSAERRAKWNERIKICGTKGTMINDIVNETLSIYSEKMPDCSNCWIIYSFPDDWENSYRREVEYFLNCILNDEDPLPSAEDGRAALAVVEAAYNSSKECKWISVGTGTPN